MVRKAVILAAGYGTRFLPTTKVVPKELLPLYDRPAIHYLVEECARSGIEEVILVISRGKESIVRYFEAAPQLEQALELKGDKRRLAELKVLSQLAKVTAVEQKEMKGTGPAVLAAEQAVGAEPFLLFYADDVMVADPPVARQVIDIYRQHEGIICAVERVADQDVPNYGIADGEMITEDVMRVSRLVEKPSPDQVKSRLAVFGRYVLTPDIFEAIRRTPPGVGGETYVTDAVSLLAAESPVYAYEFKATRYDTGRPLTMLKAAVDIALKREESSAELRSYLRSIVD